MIGESPAWQQVRALIARVAPTDSRVLITASRERQGARRRGDSRGSPRRDRRSSA
jgi:hypothetical protein